jgi:molybdopterin-guanine dinucleotide biosynthesis protein A
MREPTPIVGAILAGGRSTRFGRDKAFLPVGGVSLVERAVRVLGQVFERVLVVVRRPEPFLCLPVEVVGDAWPEGHVLGAIHAGLMHAAPMSLFVAACDMPLLDPATIRALCARAGEADMVMPVRNGLPEPLHAVYSQNCLKPAERLLRAGMVRPLDLIGKVKAARLDVGRLAASGFDARSLANVNTPEDLTALELGERD